MKNCCWCNQNKNKAEFSRNSRRKDGLQSYCKSCRKEKDSKIYSPRYAEKRTKRNIRIKKENRTWITDFKNKPCLDCKIKYPHYVMDFDHRNSSEKKFSVANALRTGGISLKRIQKEIEKCDLICANCHRIRTWKDHFGV